MNLFIIAILVLLLVNLQVLYREIRRMRKQSDLRIEALHSRLDAMTGVEKVSLLLTPALSNRVDMLLALGNEAEAIQDICDAFCVDQEVAESIIDQHRNR